mgnify:CR=1 FL=1
MKVYGSCWYHALLHISFNGESSFVDGCHTERSLSIVKAWNKQNKNINNGEN